MRKNQIVYCIFISFLKFLAFANTIQVTRHGNNFDYKMEQRNAWLYCAAIKLPFILLLAIQCVYMIIDFPLFGVFIFLSEALHSNQILIAPLLTYIYMIRNLHKRYAILNQLLRYLFYFSKKNWF